MRPTALEGGHDGSFGFYALSHQDGISEKSYSRAKRDVLRGYHDLSRVFASIMNFKGASYLFLLFLKRQECLPTKFFHGSSPID